MGGDNEAVSTDRSPGQSERSQNIRVTLDGCWVDDDRKMRQPLHYRDRGNVDCIGGTWVESSAPPLAQHHVVVTFGQDVLGSHQPLIDRRRRAPMQHHRLHGLARIFEQDEILHVVGADFKHVSMVGGELNMAGLDHLGQSRQT